ADVIHVLRAHLHLKPDLHVAAAMVTREDPASRMAHVFLLPIYAHAPAAHAVFDGDGRAWSSEKDVGVIVQQKRRVRESRRNESGGIRMTPAADELDVGLHWTDRATRKLCGGDRQ